MEPYLKVVAEHVIADVLAIVDANLHFPTGIPDRIRNASALIVERNVNDAMHVHQQATAQIEKLSAPVPQDSAGEIDLLKDDTDALNEFADGGHSDEHDREGVHFTAHNTVPTIETVHNDAVAAANTITGVDLAGPNGDFSAVAIAAPAAATKRSKKSA